jgi:hypothetical protein
LVVVSKGDDKLLRLARRTAWHFPQDNNGVYSGHYPSNDRAAIEHLECLKSKGAEFLLLPRTAFWWLKHYQEFGRHLIDEYRVLLSSDKSAMIFDLARQDIETSELREVRRAIEEWNALDTLPIESHLHRA